MALRFWTIRELVPVTDTCMGVRIKLAPRLIIVIIHKLKAFLLNKFLLNLARRYLTWDDIKENLYIKTVKIP